MNSADFADVELADLLGLFYDRISMMGKFVKVTDQSVPPHVGQLLVHDGHMTVTVERFHQTRVDVQVLRTRRDGNLYSREILLTRQSDQQVVMHGIVRLNLDELSPDVQQEILSQEVPLGRILIEHDVLREVKLLGLFRIESGPELRKHLDAGGVCYGRTALIYCDGRPAIELLEIVE